MFEINSFFILPLRLTFFLCMITATATTKHTTPKTSTTLVDIIMVILLSVLLEFEANVLLAVEKNVTSVVSIAIVTSAELL